MNRRFEIPRTCTCTYYILTEYLLHSYRSLAVYSLPSATKLGQGNIFRSVCQEFCPPGGGGLPRHMLGYPPSWDQRQAPPPPDQRQATPLGPEVGTPLGPDIPPAQCMLGDMANTGAVRILLECNFVLYFFQKFCSVLTMYSLCTHHVHAMYYLSTCYVLPCTC